MPSRPHDAANGLYFFAKLLIVCGRMGRHRRRNVRHTVWRHQWCDLRDGRPCCWPVLCQLHSAGAWLSLQLATGWRGSISGYFRARYCCTSRGVFACTMVSCWHKME